MERLGSLELPRQARRASFPCCNTFISTEMFHTFIQQISVESCKHAPVTKQHVRKRLMWYKLAIQATGVCRIKTDFYVVPGLFTLLKFCKFISNNEVSGDETP